MINHSLQGQRITQITLAALLALCAAGCGAGACPSPSAPHAWEATMEQRTLLKVQPQGAITVKRDVHNFDVSVSSDKFAAAFHRVMIDPTRHFGLIQVDRKQVNLGKPFTLGERFQGRYKVDQAISQDLPAWEKKAFGKLDDNKAFQDLICRVENKDTSDFGQITDLHLDPNPEHQYSMTYQYLSGSPIAGSSTFQVTALSDTTCRVTQIFEYQELELSFAILFTDGGLKLHDQVVYSQVSQAAVLAGGVISAMDIPDSYK